MPLLPEAIGEQVVQVSCRTEKSDATTGEVAQARGEDALHLPGPTVRAHLIENA